MAIVAAVTMLAACVGQGRQPVKSQKRVDLARDLLAHGEDAAAEVEAQKAVAFDDHNEEAWNLLGYVYLFRAHRNNRLVEIDDCLEGKVGEQIRADMDQDMRKAADAWRRAVELAPDYGDAWHNLAVVALHFEDWDGALTDLNKALANLARLAPGTEPLARANLGWAYAGKRDYTRAVSELLKATSMQDFCLGNYRLASVLFDREEYPAAVERLEPYLENARECPVQEAFHILGQGYLRLHDPDAAAVAFQKCSQLAPRSCQARQCDRALRGITPAAERVE